MALKDWKKRKSNVPNHVLEYFNEKENGVLWIQKIENRSVYYVNVSYFSGGLGSNFVNKRFETKGSAMQYARRYMEEN